MGRNDPESFADLVVVLIKNAIGPVVERLATAEARLEALGDIRDRVKAIEVTAPGPDLMPRLATLEARPLEVAAGESWREKVAAIEARTEAALADLRAAIAAGEARTAKEADRLAAAFEHLRANALTLGERVAAQEVRAQIPGPPGPPGTNGTNGVDGTHGKDGLPGKDGLDGFGFDDVHAELEGDRTLTLKFVRGDRVRAFPIPLPFMRQCGVYAEGRSYGPGDVVTWAGSQWHCHEPTATKPGDGAKAWTLIVKRGRDGRDGKDADGVPVVRR